MKKMLSVLLAVLLLLFGMTVVSVLASDATALPTEPEFTPTTPAKRADIPANATVIFDTDFSDAKLSPAKSAKLVTPNGTISPFSTATNYVDVTDVNGNRMLRFGELDGLSHGPRVEIKLSSASKQYSLDYAFALAGGKMQTDIYVDGQKINSTTIAQVIDPDDEWHYVHIDFDLEKCTAIATVDGQARDPITFPEITNFSNVKLRVSAMLSANTIAYVDSMAVYAVGEIEGDAMLQGYNNVVWNNVIPSKPIDESSYVSNLKAHPRVFVRDWDYMRSHVDDDHMTQKWYANLKKTADNSLTKAYITYSLNSRGNILESARNARNRILSLAFVYKIEGDKKYLDRAYEEMLVYGEWPDWSGDVSMLVTAEILQGYAYAYDWLYDDLSAAQKTNVMNIVKKHALPVYIRCYEENRGGVVATNNWNSVVNATAIALALAVADEEPNLSEYILEKAPPLISKYYISSYTSEGAYPEGASYWDYGTSFLLFATDFLENAFVEGFEIPENYIYWKQPGVSETPDFGIYYDGAVQKFNYGDCTSGHTSCVVMYWVANRFGKPYYAWWQNNRQTSSGSYLSGYDAVAALVWYDADNAYLTPGAFPLDKFYKAEGEVNGVSMRSSWQDSNALFAAMQGGNNGESHQHLSLGTYVIDYRGNRFIRVLGQHDYSLSGSLYYKRAESYNTLIINPTSGDDQLKKGNAQLIRYGTSDNTAFGILDMTKTHNDYESAKRGIMMTEGRNRVIVQDEVIAKKPSEFYWFANTDADVQIAEDGKSAMLTMNGERMLVRIIEGPAEARFALMERKSLFAGVNNYVGNAAGQKLYLHFTDLTELNLCVEFVPLREGEGIRDPWTFTKLENWTAEDNGVSAASLSGANMVLLTDSPNAYVNGARTLLDENNPEVVPAAENGGILVPIQFISEAFGSEVNWNIMFKTVTINQYGKEIQFVIGAENMLVNGESVKLDVLAKTENVRPFVPLGAIAQAFGKTVTKYDNGLIIIGDSKPDYTEEELRILKESLAVRVMVDGTDAVYFDACRTEYKIDVPTGATVPKIHVSSVDADLISVSQAKALGESTVVTIDGRDYTFVMQKDAFAAPVEADETNHKAGRADFIVRPRYQ